MRKLHVWLLGVLLSLLIHPAFAASPAAGPTPVGKWMTIDDINKKPKGIVQITDHQGVLIGTVIKIFKANSTIPSGLCEQCSGNFKNKPILGMTIMWGLKPQGANVWSGGQILDPKNGKIYDLKMTLSPDGKTLTVRGFIGFSMLGRTQTWIRQ